jgi:FtsZ-interacting cell division protein YlmF
MASVWQKSLMYLGLVDGEQLDDVQPPRHMAPTDRRNEPANTDQQSEQGLPGRRVEPPLPSARRSDGPLRSNSAVKPVTRTQSRCDVVEVFEFDDAKLLADRIRDRTPVLLNLREADPEMVRRVIDFSTGLTYALDGSMRKTADGVILVLPPRVSLGREEELRLSELGLFDVE